MKYFEMVFFLLWEQDVGGSNPPAPTSKIKQNNPSAFEGLFHFISRLFENIKLFSRRL